MDDGKLRLQSVQVSDSGVTCRVLEGGILKPHKGVNFPHTRLSTQALTAKDVADIGFGMETGFDVVALSFVSQASDIEILRHEMRKFGQLRPVLAKLERAACLERLDELLDVSDAVMVARGDLGIEVDIKRLPVLQKTIIAKANDRGVPVITATQMLESMTQSLLPTRAEAADVANAVFDGTDCLMLSGETAVGAHPVEAVQMMNDLIVEAEAFPAEPWTQRREPKRLRGDAISKAICHSAVVAARDLGLGNIVAVTRSGQTALDIAAFRPDATIHAFADNLVLTGFLNLSKGIQPHRCEIPGDFEELMNLVDEQLVQQGIAQMGEAVVMVLGVPITDHRATNSLIIRRVGEKLGGAGRSAQ
jgi:pyruvate kinase